MSDEDPFYDDLRAGHLFTWFVLADWLEEQSDSRSALCRTLGELEVPLEDRLISSPEIPWTLTRARQWFRGEHRMTGIFCAFNVAARTSVHAESLEYVKPLFLAEEWINGGGSLEFFNWDETPQALFYYGGSNLHNAIARIEKMVTQSDVRAAFSAALILAWCASALTTIKYRQTDISNRTAGYVEESHRQVALCQQFAEIHNADPVLRTALVTLSYSAMLSRLEPYRRQLAPLWLGILEQRGLPLEPIPEQWSRQSTET